MDIHDHSCEKQNKRIMKEKEEKEVVFRGRANVVIYENNEVDVRMPESCPNLKLVKISETKNGSLAKSPSKTMPRYMMRLSVPANVPDPAAAIMEETRRVLKPIELPDKVPKPTRGRWLERSERLQIRADPQTQEVTIVAKLPLVYTQEMIETFNTQTIQQITRCLVMQKALIAELVSAMRKCSTKSSSDPK